VSSLFEIPFLHLSCSDWKQKKKKLNKLTKNQELARGQHNIFYSSKNIPFLDNENFIDNFTKLFQEEFQKFGQKYNYKKLHLKDVWTVIYNEHDYQTPHQHGPLGWSGILYCDYDPKQPSTVFVQPWHDLKTGFTGLKTLDIKEGDMVFFPSFIMHFCPSNNMKKKRKIISWDLTAESI
jgi:hypothetical protein|tara:strand:- start:8 stop:544 length:537 start_codon:yes stop_codon:yes gene_type:complete